MSPQRKRVTSNLTYSEAVVSRIRAARIEMGMTQEQLEEAAGLDFGAVGMLEAGAYSLCVDGLALLARALKRDPRSFLPGQRLRIAGEVR